MRIVEDLGRQGQEIVCYSDRIFPDEVTRRFQTTAALWHDVAGMSDEALAQQIGADRVDILFDLAGHTARNRLLVFARKPAPVQITWAGYQGTTGLRTMDYLLAGRHDVPESVEPHYAEKILRLPHAYACFEPPPEAPPCGPLPAREAGSVTFASCSNPAKITADVVALSARILNHLPRARLILKYRGLDDPGTRRRLEELFAAHRVTPQRVQLLPPQDFSRRFDWYQQADMVLDTFPYSGSMTSCEALWMGVPVITWPSLTFAGRQTMGHLRAVGFTETIARDPDDYVRIAVALAHDLPRLAAIRGGLRGQMAASPLCDGPRLAADLLALLREVWRRRCAGGMKQDEG